VKQQNSRWQNIKGRVRYFDYKLSIRTKVTLILILIPLVIMPFVAVSLYYNNLMYNTIHGMATYSEIARICETNSFLMLKIDGSLKNYVVLRDSSYINEAKIDLHSLGELVGDGRKFDYTEEFDKIHLNIDKYTALLDSLRMIVSNEEIPHKRIERDLVKYKEGYDKIMSKILLARTNAQRDSLVENIKTYSESFDVSKILPEKNKNPGKTKIVTSLDKCKKTIDIQNGSILEKAKTHIKEFTNIGEKYASRGARNIWTVLILSVLFIIYLIVVLPERIIIPIRRLSNLIKQVEKGDFKVAIKGFPRDEIGELVYHLSRMLLQIRKIDGLKTQKILESERKFKFVINDITEGIIILNDELRLLIANKASLGIIGYDSEAIEEKSLEAIEILSGLKGKLQKLFSNGEKLEDSMLTGKNGSEYVVKFFPIRDAAGNPTGVLLLISQAD